MKETKGERTRTCPRLEGLHKGSLSVEGVVGWSVGQSVFLSVGVR